MQNPAEQPWIRRILILGAPLLAGNMSTYLMKLVDLAMLGRLGTTMLAAAGIATLAAGILHTFVWPVALGVQALSSRRYGWQQSHGDSDEGAARTGRVLSNGAVAGWMAVCLALALSLLLRPGLDLILDNEEIADLAWNYVKILRWSTIVLALGMAHRGFFAAINRTGIIMIGMVIGNVLNVLLNWVLIFGNLGFPAMGIRGAAWATFLAETILAATYIVYGLRSAPMHRYRLLRFRHVKASVVHDIIRVMIPPAVQNAAALAIFLGYQAIVERIGTDVLAVTGLVFALFRINKTLVGGFAQGASIIVGNELGAGRPDDAQRALRAQEAIAMVIGLAVAAFLVLTPTVVLRLFAIDAQLVPLGIAALRFFAGFFFVEVMGYSLEIVFNHNGWGRLVLVSEFTTNLVGILGATALAVFVFDWGIYGAWAGFALYQILHAGILATGFFSGRWKTVEVER